MRNVIISLMVFTLVTSAWAGTIVYDFEDESQLADWFEVPTLDGRPYIAQWYIDNAELVGICKDPSDDTGQGFGVRNDTWRDYTFEAQVKFRQAFPVVGMTPIVIVAVHYHLPPGTLDYNLPPGDVDGTIESMAWLGIRYSGGWNSVDWNCNVEGTWVTGAGKDMSFEEDRWYTVRFETESNHYRIFIDDSLLHEFETTYPEHAYGLPGLALINCEAHFDNVVIEGDGISSLNLASVSPKSKLATTWGCIRK